MMTSHKKETNRPATGPIRKTGSQQAGPEQVSSGQHGKMETGRVPCSSITLTSRTPGRPMGIARNTIKLLMIALVCWLPAGVAWADGAVYAMTNALGYNQILVYHRAANGNLVLVQTVATGGGGSGLQLAAVDVLGSANSLQLDEGHRLLFAVNTETASENSGVGAYNSDCRQGTITSFRVASDGMLTFADNVFSGGLFPNSIALRKSAESGDLLYVLNAGGPGNCGVSPNITGFQVNASGRMQPVGSAQAVSPGPAAGTGENCVDAADFGGLFGQPAADYDCGLNPPSFPRSPGQVQFTPDGNQLIVTVKGTSSIYVFPVENGRAGEPNITQAALPALPTSFGFAFDKNEHLLVSEAFGAATAIPANNAGAVSSYTVTGKGGVLPISSHVGDEGTGACWLALEPIDGKYAYASNSLSNNLSTYSVGKDGSVTLVSAVAATGAGPNDLAIAGEGGASFLYVIYAGTGTVGAYGIDLANGSLTTLTGGSGLPTTSAEGLAAF
ncbi:MAG: beta-propeller fold lactonase family protein [Terriglobales bacterium]